MSVREKKMRIGLTIGVLALGVLNLQPAHAQT
jgi:hypothetical protein